MKSLSLYKVPTQKAGFFWVMMVLLTMISFSADLSGSPAVDDVIRLNPDCKVKRLSNGSVIILSKNTEGIEEKHQFTDFYADLLMAAYRKQKTDYILSSFSKKYYLSQDECRREIKHALNVLAEWNIVQRNDKVSQR
jgi:hypothetical protein